MDASTQTPTMGKMVNAFNPDQLDGLAAETRDAVRRRIRLLGPAYRLFYQNPVEVYRGEGVLLYDSQGNEYLDAYNNVVSVGHGHPRVVQAISEQMAQLCTHTRYLQKGILDYAEALLATFGGSLSAHGHMMFTCTGSEANDLALRMARHLTGRRGVIITHEAYHGNSYLTTGISPSLGERSPLGTWVRQVPAPDSFRLPAETLGEWMAEQVERQIYDLERHGDGVAAFIADSAFSSDGIYTHPATVLAPVAEVVRKAGGLFIADEVQSGFGRLGDSLWGYQRHGVDPDIVTLGKPMGNGFPVAGVAVMHPIVEAFGRDMRYFNTFGGNTVAIAAAQAVLDVINDEGLVENSKAIGGFILDGLRALAERHPRVGDVRGSGLYMGVELVNNREDKTPDAAAAAAIVNGLRERRVLISATGFDANVLKIRPPLVFQREHGQRLLDALEATFAEVLG
ncbi:MAG: aspartate aminotransferase family protein [Castellaniella sp.]